MCEYHVTFCLESGNMAAIVISHRWRQLMMQKIVNKLNGPHVLLTRPVKQKHREDLTKSTGVAPAKYPLKVKLEREFLQF